MFIKHGIISLIITIVNIYYNLINYIVKSNDVIISIKTFKIFPNEQFFHFTKNDYTKLSAFQS